MKIVVSRERRVGQDNDHAPDDVRLVVVSRIDLARRYRPHRARRPLGTGRAKLNT